MPNRQKRVRIKMNSLRLIFNNLIYLKKMNNKLILTSLLLMIFSVSFGQNQSDLLSSTHWIADIAKMQAAHDKKYADIDAQLRQLGTQEARELTDKKAQEEQILSVIGQMEMIFEPNNALKIVNGGIVVLQGTWQLNASTLVLIAPQGKEEHQIIELTEKSLVLKNGETVIHYKDKNSSLIDEGKIGYKGKSMTYIGDEVGTFQMSYSDDELKIEAASAGTPYTYCDCKVQEKQGYETGTCVGQYFNEGEDGMYIKNDEGLILVGYYDGLIAKPAFAFAPNAEMLQNKTELKKLETLLKEWYRR